MTPGPGTISADLQEARQIVAALAAIVGGLHPADQRFVASWQQYLARVGDSAAIGRFRLHRLRVIAAVYGIQVEELARIDIGDLPLCGLDI